MNVQCPHCGNEIAIADSAELQDEFGLNANRQQYLRSSDRFPRPWLEFPNRYIYLRDEVIDWLLSDADVQLTDIERAIRALPERSPDRKTLIDRLVTSMSGEAPKPKRKR